MPTLTTDKIIAKLNSYFTDNQYVFGTMISKNSRILLIQLHRV